MATQLVYTSAAKLLDAGRSGFGTVARSKAISPLVVSALERVSQFANLRGTDRARTIFVHRRIVVANHRCHVLSRICDAGADYTGRTNHIAHHLILSQDEVARSAARGVTPPDVLRQFKWLDRWEEPARFFGPDDETNIEQFKPLGQQAVRAAWTALTGHPSHARLLAWDGAPRTGVLLVPSPADPLALLAEALAECGSQAWSRTFTTALESTDELSDLDWILSSPSAFSEIQSRCGARTIFDLSQPASLPLPPEPAIISPAAPQLAAPDAPPSEPATERPQARVLATRSNQPVRTTRTSDFPRTSSSSKSLGVWLVAGSAAIILIAILAVAAWKTLRPPKPKTPAVEEAPIVRLTDSQQDAVNLLTQGGVSVQDAEAIAKKSTPAPREWAQFITRMCRAIKLGEPIGTFPQPPAQREPDGVPAWLTTLTATRRDLAASPSADLIERLTAAARIHRSLRSITTDLASAGVTDAACDQLDAQLVASALKQLATGAPTPPPDKLIAQVQAAIDAGQFDPGSFPARRQPLVDFVTKSCGLTAPQAAVFADTGKLPEGFLKRSSRTSERTQSADAKPDLAKLPTKSVTLVTRLQLEQGVEVGLLRQLLQARLTPGAAQLKLAPLAISLTPADAKQEGTDLYLADDKASYCWTKMKAESAPHFFPDGRFSMRSRTIQWVQFRYENHTAIVVIDEPSEAWVRDDLSVQLPALGNTAEVTGELAEWLKGIEGSKAVVESLDLQVFPAHPALLIAPHPGGWRITLRSQHQPALVFSAADADAIATAIAAFKVQATLPGSTQNAKIANAKLRHEAFEQLEQAVCIAIGGGLLSKDLGQPDASALGTKLPAVKRLLSEKYQLSTAPPPAPTSVSSAKPITEVQSLAERVGRQQLDAEFPKLGKKVAWSELARDSASAIWIEEQLKAVLNDAQPPKPSATLAEELKKVTHLTVRTRAGRALFKASRK